MKMENWLEINCHIRGGRRCLTRWLGTKEGKRLLNFEFSLFI